MCKFSDNMPKTRKQIMNKTLIQYQTHRVLTNKYSLIEMNCQFLKIETTSPQITQSKHDHKNKE